ncbi:MAG: DNA starvation/stationary phase protection protein [Prevotella sp.]|jgi:starvation-inducible DNA-binding protein|nr:DNA starvation/stationary phase protection protein [Prevotella sp.]MCI2081266.1 DNA starvation/stationary phase protection protein [Prevotella sp.]MCI2103097.1 DNA starvation/stationary phase protection protein [Prevotella sp.]
MRTLNFTGLNENNVQKVYNALAQLLADFQVHYTNLRNLHWNIKGRRFFILHEKYEELYNSVAEKIDEVAERILQLDGTPEHRFSAYLKQAKVQELDVVKNEDAGLQYVLDTTKILIAEEREVLAVAAEVGDEVTVSLMSDYLAGQEKLVWMLAAYNTEA